MGFFVDMFDIYLPIIVLAPAIAYFIAPEMSNSTAAIVSGTIFAATLIGRPIGAAIFGHIGDTVGRKRATILALSGSGVATFLMALLPGYEFLGLLIVVVFVALRLVNGIFVGGGLYFGEPAGDGVLSEREARFLRGPDHDRLPAGVRSYLPDHAGPAPVHTGRGYQLPLRAMGLEDTVPHQHRTDLLARTLLRLLRGRVATLRSRQGVR